MNRFLDLIIPAPFVDREAWPSWYTDEMLVPKHVRNCRTFLRGGRSGLHVYRSRKPCDNPKCRDCGPSLVQEDLVHLAHVFRGREAIFLTGYALSPGQARQKPQERIRNRTRIQRRLAGDRHGCVTFTQRNSVSFVYSDADLSSARDAPRISVALNAQDALDDAAHFSAALPGLTSRPSWSDTWRRSTCPFCSEARQSGDTLDTDRATYGWHSPAAWDYADQRVNDELRRLFGEFVSVDHFDHEHKETVDVLYRTFLSEYREQSAGGDEFGVTPFP